MNSWRSKLSPEKSNRLPRKSRAACQGVKHARRQRALSGVHTRSTNFPAESDAARQDVGDGSAGAVQSGGSTKTPWLQRRQPSVVPYKGKMFSEFRLYIRYCGETRERSKRFYAWNCPKRPAAACATVQRGAHLAAPFFRRGRPRQLTWRERPREY